jgi:hypothetical protein
MGQPTKSEFEREFSPEYLRAKQRQIDSGKPFDLTEFAWMVWCHATTTKTVSRRLTTERKTTMSIEAWGDEGNVSDNGKDAAIYLELLELRVRLARWQKLNMHDFANDDQIEASDRIIEKVDTLLDQLGEL